METRNRNVVGLFIIIIIVFVWSERATTVKIASATFKIPAQAVIAMDAFSSTDGLDETQGIAIDLPNGPYFGRWGILLQSSKERHSDGMPELVREALRRNTLALSMAPFGRLDCGISCGREGWFFKRAPLLDDSVYSVGTIICHETDICKLNFSYRDVDVQVSVERKDVSHAGEILSGAMAELKKLDVASKTTFLPK